MPNYNAELAINGGNPVSQEFITIHKPVIDQSDIEAVTAAIKSTFPHRG